MLKKVGTQARKELEELLDTKIYLGLFVKVVPDWRDNPQHVRDLDWHTQLEALGEDQANKLRALHQFADESRADSDGEVSVESYEDNSEKEEKED